MSDEPEENLPSIIDGTKPKQPYVDAAVNGFVNIQAQTAQPGTKLNDKP